MEMLQHIKMPAMKTQQNNGASTSYGSQMAQACH